VDRDKVTRANAVAPYCEGGHVRLRAGAPWIGEFLDELCAFPHGAHDDMTDAFVHGMTRLIGASRAVVAVWA
jgi:predicted phage terminase large subunit-like protein